MNLRWMGSRCMPYFAFIVSVAPQSSRMTMLCTCMWELDVVLSAPVQPLCRGQAACVCTTGSCDTPVRYPVMCSALLRHCLGSRASGVCGNSCFLWAQSQQRKMINAKKNISKYITVFLLIFCMQLKALFVTSRGVDGLSFSEVAFVPLLCEVQHRQSL